MKLAKRTLDVSLAAFGLILSAPLWAIIALAIRWEDGGPIFFEQDRVGRGGLYVPGTEVQVDGP